jgi:hypothetical protein
MKNIVSLVFSLSGMGDVYVLLKCLRIKKKGVVIRLLEKVGLVFKVDGRMKISAV